ncbi:uncharacterized protein LOC110107071 [Dendrobium catenatum]|uniref:uncharacterized protein LOC110107071 n=1 Tax=Dendrobium catenatum TaxID=906689 RepID=UPI00109FAB6A|nr:uncharacterized protein LOC110107071 [Dendrobium catenatum]
MKQHRGFEDAQHRQYVCKLYKSIYGLKQSPRLWFQKLSQSLQQIGFTFSTADPSLLIYAKVDVRVFVLIYVDDMLITGNNNAQILLTLQHLQSAFHLKQLGDVSLFLGIQVHMIRIQSGTSSSFSAFKPSNTPALTKPSKLHDETLFSDPQLFRKLVGSLQYLSITRPDIAFTVNSICQFMHQPRNCDFLALKRLLRYIKCAVDFGLPITKGSLHLRSYFDADWATNPIERKSMSGYCTFLGPNLISCSSAASYAAMLDTGDFIIVASDSSVLSESFSDPTDTILPTQTLSPNSKLVAKLREYDFSDGKFKLAVQSNGDLVFYLIAIPT